VVEGADLTCSRCGRPSAKMPERPFKGQLGEKVWANVCQACWREWIGTGTKVINEMGLQLADPRAQQVYDEHMQDFLQLPE
jgi:Fe-S cluster biosynthesis and repair protein YggX